jgi:hypothetical protein
MSIEVVESKGVSYSSGSGRRAVIHKVPYDAVISFHTRYSQDVSYVKRMSGEVLSDESKRATTLLTFQQAGKTVTANIVDDFNGKHVTPPERNKTYQSGFSYVGHVVSLTPA